MVGDVNMQLRDPIEGCTSKDLDPLYKVSDNFNRLARLETRASRLAGIHDWTQLGGKAAHDTISQNMNASLPVCSITGTG